MSPSSVLSLSSGQEGLQARLCISSRAFGSVVDISLCDRPQPVLPRVVLRHLPRLVSFSSFAAISLDLCGAISFGPCPAVIAHGSLHCYPTVIDPPCVVHPLLCDLTFVPALRLGGAVTGRVRNCMPRIVRLHGFRRSREGLSRGILCML